MYNNMLFEVITASEGDELWNLPKGTVKQDIHRGIFKPYQYRKSSKQHRGTLLLLKSAMYSIYGSPKTDK